MKWLTLLLTACIQVPTSHVPTDSQPDAVPVRLYRDAVTSYASAFCSWQARCYDVPPCTAAMVTDYCARLPCEQAYPVEREGELAACVAGLEQAWCAPFPSTDVCEAAVR